eukprot:15342749-Ditylum_brightwellii.AAC.1
MVIDDDSKTTKQVVRKNKRKEMDDWIVANPKTPNHLHPTETILSDQQEHGSVLKRLKRIENGKNPNKDLAISNKFIEVLSKMAREKPKNLLVTMGKWHSELTKEITNLENLEEILNSANTDIDYTNNDINLYQKHIEFSMEKSGFYATELQKDQNFMTKEATTAPHAFAKATKNSESSGLQKTSYHSAVDFLVEPHQNCASPNVKNATS